MADPENLLRDERLKWVLGRILQLWRAISLTYHITCMASERFKVHCVVLQRHGKHLGGAFFKISLEDLCMQ